MKLTQRKQIISGSKSEESFAFTIVSDAKTFNLMMSGLYSDPIVAFIRELGTNAYEAHQSVGKEKIPFEVTLPTYLNPSFVIRDFGPGLSVEDVRTLYTCLGKSSKDNTNDVGGCFGLGSKSPFAYSDNFGIISRYQGVKYCYSVHKNEEGLPCMDLMHQEATTEESGLEVSVPIKSGNINDVTYAAVETYGWFITRPKLINGQYTKEKPQEKNGYYKLSYNGLFARMGNIVYPIGHDKINVRCFAYKGALFDFNIGDLTPTPSRDALQYNEKTIRAINKKIAEARDLEVKAIQARVDASKTYYEACSTFKSDLIGYREFKWNGVPLACHFPFNLNCIQVFRYYPDKLSVCKLDVRYDEPVVVVHLKDTERPLAKICKYVQDNKLSPKYVLCSFNKLQDVDSRKQLSISEMAKFLNYPEELIVDGNTLPAPAIAKKAHSKAGLKYFDNKFVLRKSGQDIKNIQYYVEIKNNTIVYNDKKVPNYWIGILSRAFGLKEIYAVNQSLRKNVPTNAVNILKEFKDKIVAYAQNNQNSSQHYNFISKMEESGLHMSTRSNLRELIATYNECKKSIQNKHNLEQIVSLIYDDVKLIPFDKSHEEKLEKTLDTYPLLRYTSEAPLNLVEEYMELMDNK